MRHFRPRSQRWPQLLRTRRCLLSSLSTRRNTMSGSCPSGQNRHEAKIPHIRTVCPDLPPFNKYVDIVTNVGLMGKPPSGSGTGTGTGTGPTGPVAEWYECCFKRKFLNGGHVESACDCFLEYEYPPTSLTIKVTTAAPCDAV